MMNMMSSTTGMGNIGSAWFWLHLHWFFGAFAIVGFILFIVWALRNLQGNALKMAALWLLGIGIAGALLTASQAATGFLWMMGTVRGNHMMQNGAMMQMRDMMMDHDEADNDDEHDEMLEMMDHMMGQ